LNIVKDLYEDHDFPFKSISDQFGVSGESFQKLEILINLPFDFALEQIEFQIANNELFTKYLKLMKIETSNADRPVLHLRGGFYD
jgi:hypothetical protein